MTTIAYHHKDKQIAVDGRGTIGSLIASENFDKIIKNESGTWFLTGKACDFSILTSMQKDDNTDVMPECHALLARGGKVYAVSVSEDGYFCEDELKYNHAIGSGDYFAIAAMDFGRSAKEAVKYAATRDCYTGGKIKVINVGG